MVGDELRGVDGLAVPPTFQELIRDLRPRAVGDIVQLVVTHHGHTRRVAVTLGARPPPPDGPDRRLRG